MKWYWECLFLECISCGRHGYKDKNMAKEAGKNHLMDKHQGDGKILVYQAKFCKADIKHYQTEIYWTK